MIMIKIIPQCAIWQTKLLNISSMQLKISIIGTDTLREFILSTVDWLAYKFSVILAHENDKTLRRTLSIITLILFAVMGVGQKAYANFNIFAQRSIKVAKPFWLLL